MSALKNIYLLISVIRNDCRDYSLRCSSNDGPIVTFGCLEGKSNMFSILILKIVKDVNQDSCPVLQCPRTSPTSIKLIAITLFLEFCRENSTLVDPLDCVSHFGNPLPSLQYVPATHDWSTNRWIIAGFPVAFLPSLGCLRLPHGTALRTSRTHILSHTNYSLRKSLVIIVSVHFWKG